MTMRFLQSPTQRIFSNSIKLNLKLVIQIASRVHRPESSVQCPAFRVQDSTLAPRVQELEYVYVEVVVLQVVINF